MIDPETLIGDKSVECTYPKLNDGIKIEYMYEIFGKECVRVWAAKACSLGTIFTKIPQLNIKGNVDEI